nr:hypothetical protein [Tanacetum cinerariifolium]
MLLVMTFLLALKFVPKGEKDEVFGKPIPKELITEAIQTSPYYQQYLDMVARKPTAKRDKQKKTASAAGKPKKPTPVKKPAPAKQTKHKPFGGVAFHEPASDAETRADTDKTNSEGDTEILNVGEEQEEYVSNKVDLEEKTAKINEGQAGSDPGKTPKSRPSPERVLIEEGQAGPNPGQSHMALDGPNPEPMHEYFVATVAVTWAASAESVVLYYCRGGGGGRVVVVAVKTGSWIGDTGLGDEIMMAGVDRGGTDEDA